MRAAPALLILTGMVFGAGPSPRAARFFDRRVAPILVKRCLGCHNDELKNAGLSFLDRESLLIARSRGAAIVPGDPVRSLLVQSIERKGDIQMPPGPSLSRKEIRILTEWVEKGAVWGTKLRAER